MEPARGSMTASRLFSVNDLELGNPGHHLDRVIKEFLSIGEAIAARWIEMPKAVVLLQMVPGDGAPGAITSTIGSAMSSTCCLLKARTTR